MVVLGVLSLFSTTGVSGVPFKKKHHMQNIFEEFFHLGVTQAPIFKEGVQWLKQPYLAYRIH